MGFRGRRYILPLVIVALLGVAFLGAQIKIQKVQKVQIKPKLIRANPVLLRQMYYVRKNVPYIKILKKKEIPLIPLSMMRIEAPMRIKRVHKSEGMKFLEASKKKYPSLKVNYLKVNLKLVMAFIRARMDHRPKMTPIRDQGHRGTCVAFACMAALEPFPTIPDDLSEQYAYYIIKRTLDPNPSPCRDGVATWRAADVLRRQSVCEERYWRYNKNRWSYPNKSCIDNLTQAPPPSAARRNAHYGIQSYRLIFDDGPTGTTSIKNVDYLKRIIFANYNIVIGLYVAGTDWGDGKGIIRVQYDARGNPVSPRGGHAMLICGYNDKDQYFIVKNSWGPSWGHSGYAYISYNYIRQYAKYGFYVIRARTR